MKGEADGKAHERLDGMTDGYAKSEWQQRAMILNLQHEKEEKIAGYPLFKLHGKRRRRDGKVKGKAEE